ncbi:MAG: ABC transporter permease [candidate division Zixibacteria bacterium]|nr:ABC transporter permease [candidate division Zixibacteria bacterium]MBU1471037.1 ABC transporter permease [candidate division Zixibacteria bacterium]MBU2625072.1 ABC transporter permease [candidate division Zixibacteria bacterium]
MLGNIKLIVRLFLRELKSQKLRMSLTILAIIWGTLSITMLMAFGEGLRRQLAINRKGLGDGILILWGGQTEKPYKGLPRGRQIRFASDDIDFIKKQIPELGAVGGEFITWGREITYGDKTVNAKVNGVMPEYEFMRSLYAQEGGRFFNRLDMEHKRRVVFLGNEMRDDLFGEPESPDYVDPIGKVITISDVQFTVIGIMQKKQQMGMYSGPDWNTAFIPLTTFETMYSRRTLSNMVLKPRDIKQVDYVKDRLYQVMSGKYQFHPDDKRALSIWDVIETAEVMNKVMIGMQIFFGIIGGLTLLVAGVGVANIMYVAVRERTAEIGVKMAMGAKRGQIMTQFMLEAVLIAGIGGGMGLLISYTIAGVLGMIPMDSDAMQWLGKPTISMPIAMTTISVLAMIGLVSGFFPARRAASVNPVESLRYE